jgi:DNA-binding CsgD family transcriptional regulator
VVPPNRFRWTPRLARLLGRIPDEKLATIAGIDPATVLKERRRRKIPPSQPRRANIEWTREMLRLLGQASDYRVAAELGISYNSVRRKRVELGIPPSQPPRRKYAGFKWTRKALRLLGSMSDKKVAQRLGLSPAPVTRKRQALGIAPWGSPPRLVEWTAEMLGLLGTVRDSEFARRFGVSENSVLEKRQTLGIDPYSPRHPWTEMEVALLGTMPDPQVAQRVGVSVPAVRTQRRSRGIAPLGGRRERHIWTADEKARLGSVPDALLARELGLTREVVTARRLGLGIRPCKRDRPPSSIHGPLAGDAVVPRAEPEGHDTPPAAEGTIEPPLAVRKGRASLSPARLRKRAS